ncbi:hypothetical protein BTVI_157084 [Pitangus sulphuratus]|nr:hypothetical protein BTVI_157084 [Pitangus sulphuratus]
MVAVSAPPVPAAGLPACHGLHGMAPGHPASLGQAAGEHMDNIPTPVPTAFEKNTIKSTVPGQEDFYSASNFTGILLFFMCSDEANRISAAERKDSKDLKLIVSCMRQLLGWARQYSISPGGSKFLVSS